MNQIEFNRPWTLSRRLAVPIGGKSRFTTVGFRSRAVTPVDVISGRSANGSDENYAFDGDRP